jgi:DNA-binding PadR family transcriptional regulator
MNVRTLCLAILKFGDASGYEIKKKSTESQFAYFVDASFGSIYPALTRLEKDGCVTWREEREPGKPAAKIYSITDAGTRELVEALGTPPKADIFKSEFLLVAMCAELLDRETLAAAIDHYIAYQEAEMAQIDEAVSCTDHPGTRWIAEHGKACMLNCIERLKNNRHELEALAQPSAQAAAAE